MAVLSCIIHRKESVLVDKKINNFSLWRSVTDFLSVRHKRLLSIVSTVIWIASIKIDAVLLAHLVWQQDLRFVCFVNYYKGVRIGI